MKILIVLIIAAFLIHLYFKLFKIPKISNLVLTSGGVKTGKSTLTVYFAYKKYKAALRWYKISKFFIGIFSKKKAADIEEPLLYSNIPLKCNYVPLTKPIILRQERMRYKSVAFIDEASLVADSMAWGDDNINEQIRLFFKLIAHETHGGCAIIDTQQPDDLHFGIKRNISSYFYIHRIRKLPFFIVLYVREMLYSDNAGVQNVFNDDIEFGMRRVIMPKKIWKMFDCYAFSGLTDDLPVAENVVDGTKLPDLKVRGEYLTFRMPRKKKEEKKNEKG